MKRKPYPTFEECIAIGKRQQKAEPATSIKKRFDEIPQDRYGGINVERLQISNLMEEIGRFTFGSFTSSAK